MLFSKQYRKVVMQNCQCLCLHTQGEGTTIRENIRAMNRGQQKDNCNNANKETRL